MSPVLLALLQDTRRGMAECVSHPQDDASPHHLVYSRWYGNLVNIFRDVRRWERSYA